MNVAIRQALRQQTRRFTTALLLTLSLPVWAGPVDDAIRARLEPLASAQPSRTPARTARTTLPQAVAEFYAQRQWQPIWDDDRVQSLLAALADTYTDGLNPEDYFVTALQRLPRDNALQNDPQTKAERDVLATHGYLLALEQLYHGKADPRLLDPHWNFDARQFDPEHGLALAREAVEQRDIAGIFTRARPNAPQYDMLRNALSHLRAMAQNGVGWTSLPAGPTLKPGASDVRVPLLRQRLREAELLPPGDVAQPNVYDPALVAAVKRFQEESYLDADGAVGPQTLATLNVPLVQRIDQVRVNLERARWLLHELQGSFVVVDVAGYRISYVRDGNVVWRSRVQIGKEYRATPIFKSTITYITLSPGWVIPPTILRQDTLPAIRRDSSYLARNNLHVYNAAGKELAATDVDWSNPGNISLRQEPGPTGALGEMAIRFANPYAVYLHDTPYQAQFNNSQRATSSGCIRVENVHELAVLLFDDQAKWNREAMQNVINERKTRNVTLAKPVPILLAYWTVDVGEDGHVAFKPDVYRRDSRVLAALNATP
ncbi:MAG: L,D-transpeptidase family protein [Pseudomonadales bacterium]|jgi:murein L,D-transpeptidase YcbB/YkuD|nr:L,D-transpeptidase family protein [Pseudomonadales bacterium]